MRCSRVQEMLNRYLAGSCSSLESETVAEHLAGCSGCAARLAEMQELNELLDLWQPESAPEDLLQSVIQPLHSQPQRQRPVRTVADRTAMLIRHLAAAAILALAFNWGVCPWLSSSQAMAGESADKLVSGYSRASDTILKDAVNTGVNLTSKLNYFEEWMQR